MSLVAISHFVLEHDLAPENSNELKSRALLRYQVRLKCF